MAPYLTSIDARAGRPELSDPRTRIVDDSRGLAWLRVASKLLVLHREPDTMEIVMSDDVTLKVLIEIRDGIAATNSRVDQTNRELAQLRVETNHRLDEIKKSRLIG